MKDGFIKLHRKIQDHWLWKNGEPFDKRSAWIDLLLLANWETATNSIKGIRFEQKRGEVVESISFLAKRWGWSENKVRRFVADLSAEGMVRADGRAYGTSITIENYELFQSRRRADGRANERADGRPDGRQEKKNKEELKETRAREGSVDEPAAAPEEGEAEAMPDWFKEQVENTFGRM